MSILPRIGQAWALGIVVGGKGVGGVAVDDVGVLVWVAPRIPDHAQSTLNDPFGVC